MSFRLEHPAADHTRVEELAGEDLLLGRGTNAGLHLADSAVALEHARLRRTGDGLTLQDLGSVTGTYVNGAPVTTTRLHEGDEIGLGDFRLRVKHLPAAGPVTLELRALEPAPAAAVSLPREVDYAAAYRLRQGPWRLAVLVLLAAVAAAALLGWVVRERRLDLFRPGELTGVHASLGVTGCDSCHRPFAGVPDAGCQSCHGPGGVDPVGEHHPVTPAAALACTHCHTEHQGADALMRTTSADCVSCHRDLAAVAPNSPRFASPATRFPREHPPFAIELAGRRVPLTDPAARQADPARLHFSHAQHLASGLLSPEGRVQLGCEACHGEPGPEDLATPPVTFEQHCQRCHALSFDDAFPDRRAPHGTPREVRAELLRTYVEERRAPRPLQEEVFRLLALGGSGAGSAGSAQSPAARGLLTEALRAELRLYRTNCTQCHFVDLTTQPHPTIEPVGGPRRWFPHTNFRHGDHRFEGLTCQQCHAAVKSSKVPADLDLPGVEVCGACHGGEAVEGSAGAWKRAGGGCGECHGFHGYEQANSTPGKRDLVWPGGR